MGPRIQMLQRVSAFGNAGVDLFFVLSGFLITSILIETRHRESYYADFYWKRILRIQPLYVLCLLIVLWLYPSLWPGVLLSALFVVNFGAHFHIVMFGPFWSLAIEEQFYLLWPSVVRRRSVPQIAGWSAAIAIACMLIRLCAGLLGHHNYYYTFYHCDGLALGALIACWFEQRSRRPAERRFENGLLNTGLLGGAGLVALAIWFVPPPHEDWAGPVFQTGVALASAGFIGRLVRDGGSRYLAPLRSRLLTFFGLISYAFYMLHLFVLNTYDHLRPLGAKASDGEFLLRFVVVLAVSIAAALISRYAVELPALSLRRYVLKAPSAPPVTAEPIEAV